VIGTTAAPKPKLYHRAKLVDPDGRVSPLCAGDKPRAIDLRRASWTLRPEAVTCPRCRRLQARAVTPPSLVQEPTP
jgi:hypothetical protein